ncbi:MAG: trypsin-like peptidase domain-containing protein [Deltaproteobacteria bacterium]|nr:trypsin-like peptidase domain-containing protein [Deltaproteobacteria bacterium]
MALSKKPIALFFAITLWGFCPPQARSDYLLGPRQLSEQGAAFDWEEARAKSVKIQVEHRDRSENGKRASMGSGFLISPDGYFITAYHVMMYCLENRREQANFSRPVNCSTEHPVIQYTAQNGDREFEIEVISYLSKRESTNGTVQTPDEIIKHRDFVLGRLKAAPGTRFRFWNLRHFNEGTIDLQRVAADFQLKPMMPPKKVFIAGYPAGKHFAIAHGFLNLTEDQRRGYFAADLQVYDPGYLKKHGISPDTKWGISVENHISGGAVLDASGTVIGLIVNGNANTAGILSIENVLETFFSREPKPGRQPAVLLSPTETLLYLKE